MSVLERRFMLCWRAVGGPDLVREIGFVETRRWRFDFAHPETRTAIEIEGGTWSGGRHTRGAGFVRDAEKYNTAALCGWTVFRLPSPLVGVAWAERIRDHIRRRMK
jgi:hypothetical protein